MRGRSTGNGISIAQLVQMLAGQRTELARKQKERKKLMTRLDRLDAEIRALGGDGRGGRGGAGGRGRTRNQHSLIETLEMVLKGGKPMRVGEIAEAAQRGGYRSNSANFRSIVNQTLIKDSRFNSTGRGVYQLKKSA